jgi:hypothetical protein
MRDHMIVSGVMFLALVTAVLGLGVAIAIW